MDEKKFLLQNNSGKFASIKRECYEKIGSLDVSYYMTKEPVPFESIDKTKLKPIRKQKSWSNNSFDCAWFHMQAELPKVEKNQHVALLIFVGGEGECRDDNGVAINGTTAVCQFVDKLQPVLGKRLVEIPQHMLDSGKVEIWVEAGNNKKENAKIKLARLKQTDIVIVRDDVKEFYYDYLALTMQAMELSKNEEHKKQIEKALDESYKLLGSYSEDEVKKANAVLKSLMSDKSENKFTSYSIGHAHLDLAYLWPIRETKRKAVRTFSNALANMEKYDEYIFGASQPQQFEWVQQNEPEVFERLKKAIAEDRIELQGGMWVEIDSNVSGGESIVRQNIYGQRYWQENFGKTSRVCWLPDAFGFSANLPQFCKKSGMDYFMTTKISWNEHNKFPHDTFMWEGIDGTKMLTAFPPEKNYISDNTPWSLNTAAENLAEKEVLDSFLTLYGVGDGGGGPSEGHLEMGRRCNEITTAPNVKFAPAIDYFEHIKPKSDLLSTYKGELYLEKHQGTFTTQAKNKKYNRKIEFLFHNVELLATQAIEKGFNYPKEKMDELWKEFLLYQFHDILPGSSISRVYKESVERYQVIEKELEDLFAKMLTYFEQSEKKQAFNATSFDFDGYIKKDGTYYHAKVPAYSCAEAEVLTEKDETCSVSDDTMENDILSLEFDDNGEIVSLIDKRNGKQYAKKPLNMLAVYEDKKLKYNAWDICIDYPKQTPKRFKFISSESKITPVGAMRVSKYKFGKSTLTQTITLNKNADMVSFDTKVDWHEQHKMLRANFESTVFSDTAICDIQMGNLERSTKDETKIEKAAFEVCAHKYVDLFDGTHGISYITDCKYGWRLKEGLASLNLLRGTVYPDKKADQGQHEFSYAIYVHENSSFDSDTVKNAYQFNNPPMLLDCKAFEKSVVTSSDKHVVVETVKPSEDGEGTVVRIYEDAAAKREIKLYTTIKYKKAYETDMLENIIGEVDLDKLNVESYEIKTIKLV